MEIASLVMKSNLLIFVASIIFYGCNIGSQDSIVTPVVKNEIDCKKDTKLLLSYISKVDSGFSNIRTEFELGFDFYFELGNGFVVKKGGKSIGKYCSVSFLGLYKDSLIGGQIVLNIPDCIKKDSLNFISLFSDSNYKNKFIYEYTNSFDLEKMQNKLSSYSLKFKYLMSPYSEIEYGFYGGYGMDTLVNRAIYESIKDSIDINTCNMMLNSLNPATRIFGAEWYYINQKKYRDTLLELKIENNFNNNPLIYSYTGDINKKVNARDLLNVFIK